MTDENLENNEIENVEETSPRTRPLPYATDPGYKDLLLKYQNGDWDACTSLIETLLKNYPGDSGLIEFQNEVRVKQSLQQSTVVTDKEDRRKNVLKTGGMIGIIVIVLGAIIIFGYSAISKYTTRVSSAQQTQQAETSYRTLRTKLENAEDLIQSGRPTGALLLLEEIQEVDPEFEGLAETIERAETIVYLDTLLAEANQQYVDGLLEESLQTYQKIDSIEPSYRDTRLRMSQVEQDIEINRLLAEISASYDIQDWQAVIDAYEAIIELDPATDLDEHREKLFTAYMNLIIETADKIDSTIEDVDKAQEYYKAALALFPQDREFAGERAELQKLATKLIANNYFLFAMDLLETEGYGPDTMYEVLRILNAANNIGAGSPAIEQEIERATLFVSGFDQLVVADLDGAIDDLELLYRQDPDYGEGLVQYLLFEAYLARGDLLFTYAEYEAARGEYELAETFAWGDHGNALRLFEVEIRIGYALRRLGLMTEAAEYYNYALNLVNFHDKVRVTGEIEQIENFEAAREALLIKDEWNAARLFEIVLEDVSVIYTLEEAEVKRGQSLYMLAFDTGSTASALREINELGVITSFKYDQQIQIPRFIEADE
jgi:tetratricopeptide (TPR) repeat protein